MIQFKFKIFLLIFLIIQIFNINSLFLNKLHKVTIYYKTTNHFHLFSSTNNNNFDTKVTSRTINDRSTRLLENARKLRLEAEILEIQNSSNSSSIETLSDTIIGNKEFIAETKLKPTNNSVIRNTEFNPMKDIFNNMNSLTTSNSNMTNSKSILVERKDLNKNKILANKITSGNNVPSPPKLTTNMISPKISKEPIIKPMEEELGDNDNYSNNQIIPKLPPDVLVLQYDKLQSLEESVYKSLEPWWLRWGYRVIAKDALNSYIQSGKDTDSERSEEDILLYKVAFVIELYQVLQSETMEEVDLLSLFNLFNDVILARMDFLRKLYLNDHSCIGQDEQKQALKAIEPLATTTVATTTKATTSAEEDDDENVEIINSIKDDDNKLDSIDIFNNEIQSMSKLMNNMLERQENSSTLLRSPNKMLLNQATTSSYNNNTSTSSSFDRGEGIIQDPQLLTNNAKNAQNVNKETTTTVTQNKEEDESNDTEEEGSLMSVFLNQLEDALYENEENNAENMKTTAEALILQYFDSNSRKNGLAIDRDGAGRFQNEVLKNIMTVTDVKLIQGAVVFNGQSSNPGIIGNRNKDSLKNADMAIKIQEKYMNSSFVNEIDYFLIKNEIFPNFDGGMQQAAIESLLGSSPAVIIYPKSWNSTVVSVVNDPSKKFFRNLISSIAISTSLIYAVDRVNLFDENSIFMKTGEISEYLLPMALTSVFIQNIASFFEFLVAKSKNIEINQVYLPSFGEVLFSFGQRSTYLTKPKNRNDIFDTSFVRIFTSLTLSLIAIYLGQEFTKSDSSELYNTYPTIPVSLLQVNTFISQVFLKQFGDLYQVLPTFSTELAASVVDNIVHLHWLTIVGVTSFITTIFQLIPTDNSVGSKLTGAVVGRENYQAFTVIFGAFKAIFILLMIFNVGGYAATPLLNKQRLLLDYFIVSQLVHNEKEVQLAQDNLTEVSDGRRNIYYGLLGMLVISFFPYQQISSQLTNSIDSFIDTIKNIF